MQAQALQRAVVQPRVAVRTTQFGSCSSIRGASPLLMAARPVARPQAALTVGVVATAAVEAQIEAEAHTRYQRGSPMKFRRVLDQIRGRSYEEALMVLEYMPYKACESIIKTLLSAAANAKHNLGLKKKDLYVTECYANEGPVLKRIRPRAQGRANAIHKPTVHICVKVAERQQ